MYRKKNVVQKKSSTSKTPSRPRPRPAAVSKKSNVSPAASKSRNARTESHHTGDGSTQVLIFRPGLGGSAILPREYFTRLRTSYSGIWPVAAFEAGPGQGNLSLPITMCVNDVIQPFGGTAFAGTTYQGWANTITASQPTWMDLGAVQTPTTNSSNSVYQLFTAQVYGSVLVNSASLSISINPSVTANNDDIILTITPSCDLTGTPGSGTPPDVYHALNMDYTVHETFHGTGNGPRTLTQYIDFPSYLGLSKEEWENDPAMTYANVIGGSTLARSSPQARVFFVVNANVIDLTTPTQVVPFTVTLDQYVKFFNLTLNENSI